MTKSATMQLIEAVELLGAGDLLTHEADELHELATLARLEQHRLKGAALALQENDPHETIADNGMTVTDAVRGVFANVFGAPTVTFRDLHAPVPEFADRGPLRPEQYRKS